MPRLVLRKAYGIAVIPDMFKAGFIFGARFGRGVVMVRQPDGTWSNPVFIHLLGGSFGAQAGAQSTDLVLVFQSQKGLDRFLQGKDKMTLGVDIGAAAGPVGKRFEASTDLALKAEVLSYSNSRGIFAGASAEGGTLQIDWKSNTFYYNKPVTAGEILAVNSSLAVPESTVSLKQVLAEKTAWPERIVRGRRPGVIRDGDRGFDAADGIEFDGAIEEQSPPLSPPEPVRGATRRRAKPRPEPDDDDLDPLPPARTTEKAPRHPRPRATNDEDLPEAASESSAPKAKLDRKPPPQPKSDTDDVPDLEPPQSN
jgi:SH3 domain-containing YSC84-like protein 1